MSEEEKRVKAKQVKKNLTEMVKNEIWQLSGRDEIMKIIRAEVKKEVKAKVKWYLTQIMPDDVEIGDIIRKTLLAMGEKKK